MAQNGKLNLPKPHLSSSQISTWKYNKGQYLDRYIFNIPTQQRPELLYGKQFSTWLEKGWDDAPQESKEILNKIKRYAKAEHELKDTFQTPKGSFDFLGYIDSYDPETHALVEYKTGSKAWDSARALEHLQTRLYAGVIFKQTGVVPKVEIIWIPTKQVDGVSIPVGDVFVFPVKLTVNRILLALKEMERTALEIHDWYTEYEKTANEILTV